VKLKFLTTGQLKTIGINLFLKNISMNKINEKAALYAKKIKLNKIYYEDYKSSLKSDNWVFVISASFDVYLKHIFNENDVTLIASSIYFDNGFATGLKYECYGDKKIEKLNHNNVYRINVLYTDSYSDTPIAKISDKIYIINGNDKIICNTYTEFKK
jgi:phosphoserine phosphatase